MKLFASTSVQTKVVIALLLVFSISRLLVSLIPQFQVDPLYYHATIPWRWSRSGVFEHFEWLPWYMQGGLVETGLTAVAWFFSERLYFLVTAQCLNLIAGSIIAGFFLYQILKDFVPRQIALLGLLCFLTIPDEAMMLVRAKNDGYILAFFCAGLYFFYRSTLTHARLVIRDVFCMHLALALALACKHTALFFILPMAVLVLVRSLRDPQTRRLLPYHFGFLLLFLPIGLSTMIRNYILCGNPVFPAMSHIFPNRYVNPFIEEGVRFFTKVPGTVFEIISAQLTKYFYAKPVFLLAIIPPAISLARPFYYFYWSGLILLMILTGQGFSTRFGFFLYALGALLACINAWQLSIDKSWRDLIFWPLLIAVLVGGKIEVPLQIVAKNTAEMMDLNFDLEEYATKHEPLYQFHKNTRGVIPDSSLIWSEYYNANFFLDCQLATPENHPAATTVLLARNYEEALLALDREGFSHIQLQTPYTDRSQILRTGPLTKDFRQIGEAKGYELWERVRAD